MSIKIMTLVWDIGELSGSDKLVLLALADMANDEGQCWPSLVTIAKKSSLSKRYVVEIIKKLIELKYIKRQRRGTTSNLYNVLPGVVRQGSLPLVRQGSLGSEAGITTASEAGITRVVRPASLKPSINRQLNHKEPSYAIPASLNIPTFLTAWEAWKKYRAELKKKITDSTASRQLAKLEKHSPEVAIAMIEQSIEHGWQGLFDLKEDVIVTPLPKQERSKTFIQLSNGEITEVNV